MVEEVLSDGECLALVIKVSTEMMGTTFLTPTHFPLQVGIIQRNQTEIIPAHHHKTVDVRYEGPRNEFLHIIEGRVRVTILNKGGEDVAARILEPGDSLLQIAGGHKFEFLENSRMIEVKQGPYAGKEKDKIVSVTGEGG